MTWRFIRWRATERRAIFFGTTTAYPLVFSGMTAVKYSEEILRPFLKAEGKRVRLIRFRRGNTLGSKAFTPDAPTRLDDFTA